jgi:hypothetical protein
LFADDSLLLLEASVQTAEVIKSILQVYEECSGHMINRDKSSVMFSSNARNSIKKSPTSSFGTWIRGDRRLVFGDTNLYWTIKNQMF